MTEKREFPENEQLQTETALLKDWFPPTVISNRNVWYWWCLVGLGFGFLGWGLILGVPERVETVEEIPTLYGCEELFVETMQPIMHNLSVRGTKLVSSNYSYQFYTGSSLPVMLEVEANMVIDVGACEHENQVSNLFILQYQIYGGI